MEVNSLIHPLIHILMKMEYYNLSSARAPQQNRVVERKKRILQEMASTMLDE